MAQGLFMMRINPTPRLIMPKTHWRYQVITRLRAKMLKEELNEIVQNI
jgi:hypothetical protein